MCVAGATIQGDADRMAVDVYFDDGPAGGRIEHMTYLSVALPSLAWLGDSDQVLAVYQRQGDDADAEGVWHYRQTPS